MANATLAKLGVRNGASDGSWAQENANFLEVFSGEVLTAFETATIFKELHRVRTITHGKSADFPVLGKMSARYHTPGTPILGTNNPPTNPLNGVDAGDTTVYQLAQNLSFGTTYY